VAARGQHIPVEVAPAVHDRWPSVSRVDDEEARHNTRVAGLMGRPQGAQPLRDRPANTVVRGRGMTDEAASEAAAPYEPSRTVTERGVLVWSSVG
jgi:hypothetical protein